MSRKLKWGVIGSGGIARRRTIPEGIAKARNAELSVVFDIDQQVNAEVAKKSGAEQAASINQLLDTDIDMFERRVPLQFKNELVQIPQSAVQQSQAVTKASVDDGTKRRDDALLEAMETDFVATKSPKEPGRGEEDWYDI